MGFKPAETIQELTMDKLKETIRYVYEPYGMLDGVTEDYYIKVMSYLQEKHRNLRWLLGDNLRIPVEGKLSISTIDESTLNELRVLEASSGHTAEEMIENVKLLNEVISGLIVTPAVIKKVIEVAPSLLPTAVTRGIITKDGYCFKDGNSFGYRGAHPSIAFSYALKLQQNLKVDTWLSMEPSDMLLVANSGSTRSCHRVDGPHHSGSVANMLADFALVHYRQSSRHSYSGRQWVWLPMTKNGIPYASPFMKLQKVYGTLPSASIKFAINTILDKFSGFGTNPKDFVVNTSQSLGSSHMSRVYASGVAYLDSSTNESSPWVLHKNAVKTEFTPLRFDHPMPIGFSGKAIANGSMYKVTEREVALNSGLDTNIVSDYNGVKRDGRECYNIDGKVVSLTELIANFKGTEVKPVETVEAKPVEDTSVKIKEIELDMEDF